jgi:hypothetical protein
MTPTLLQVEAETDFGSSVATARGRTGLEAALCLVRRVFQAIASGFEWLLGVLALLVGLALIAAIPIVQFLSFGYFLESSARVARSGRLRDGLIGVRPAARIGGLVAGTWLALQPLWLLRSFTESAEWIESGGQAARSLNIAFWFVGGLTMLHIMAAWARGGKLRRFLWPVGNYLWLLGKAPHPGRFYVESRDASCAFVTRLKLPHFFKLGFIGYFGTLVWLLPPGFLIASGGRFPILGFIGALLLALIVPFLPFLQVGYATDGRLRAMFDRKSVKRRFARAPWAFAFSLLVLLVASIPLYLLKIELIPREAAWLPCLVFVVFLAPARPLIGWAYARAGQRAQPRHWFFRIVGRFAILPISALYVLVVLLSQYTSWAGTASLFEQHAFLLPVPFYEM